MTVDCIPGNEKAKLNTLSELSNYSAMYTKTHYVMNIPIYGAHAQLNQVPKALQYQVS